MSEIANELPEPSPIGSAIDAAWEELLPLVDVAIGAVNAVGEKLVELERRVGVGVAGVRILIRRIYEVKRMPQTYLMAQWNIARRQLPVELLQTKCQPNTLAKIDEEAARQILDGEPRVVLDKSGNCVERRPRDFDEWQHARYTTPAGVLSESEVKGTEPSFRSVRISSIRVDREEKLMVLTFKSQQLHALVDLDMLEAALAE